MERQKLTDLHSVQVIKDWTSKGKNYFPGDDNVAYFIRDLIPYLENLEARIVVLESKPD